jgi:hypothetical protein
MILSLPPAPPPLIAAKITCPADLTGLVPLLVRDIPSYANRIIVRGRQNVALQDLPAVIVAGQAAPEPLPVESDLAPNDPNLQQLFLTTLERQRVGDRMVESQQFHWLFLIQTTTGWQLSMSYTRSGGYPQADKPITPPRESSQGVIGQTVMRWLRDCNAGSIRPLKSQ